MENLIVSYFNIYQSRMFRKEQSGINTISNSKIQKKKKNWTSFIRRLIIKYKDKDNEKKFIFSEMNLFLVFLFFFFFLRKKSNTWNNQCEFKHVSTDYFQCNIFHAYHNPLKLILKRSFVCNDCSNTFCSKCTRHWIEEIKKKEKKKRIKAHTHRSIELIRGNCSN